MITIAEICVEININNMRMKNTPYILNIVIEFF